VERAAFLLEETGERISCLLNPSSLVQRREAGVTAQRSLSGAVTGAELADDRLVATGGGATELEMALVFDVHLSGSTRTTEDVRDLTGPFWRLAENVARPGRFAGVPQVTFVWGKAWWVPGLVLAVAERFERFGPGGQPARSWLSLRLRRLAEGRPRPPEPLPALPVPEELPSLDSLPAASLESVAVAGGGAGLAERLETVLARLGVGPEAASLVAALNGVADPLRLAAGQVLRVPSPALLEALCRRS
jgi:hypothetical protein